MRKEKLKFGKLKAEIIFCFLLSPFSFCFGANEPINVNSLDGKVKQTSSSVGSLSKPFDFSSVNVTGISGGGGSSLTAGTGIDITAGVISVNKTLITLQGVDTTPTLDDIMLTYDPVLDQMRQVALGDLASHLSINSVTDSGTGKRLFFNTSALTADRNLNSPDADTVGVIPMSVATSNQFITFISGGGVQNHAQPGFSNLFGNINHVQMNSGTGASSTTFWRGDDVWAAPTNHAVYAAASPPTIDVGVFTISKTGIDLKTAGNTNIFTVPSGRVFVCTGAVAVVTSVTTPGAGTENFQIKESGTNGSMTAGGASASGTPAVGIYYAETIIGSSGPFTQCAAGNNVLIAVAASQAGSVGVTGTVFVNGFYTQ